MPTRGVDGSLASGRGEATPPGGPSHLRDKWEIMQIHPLSPSYNHTSGRKKQCKMQLPATKGTGQWYPKQRKTEDLHLRC